MKKHWCGIYLAAAVNDLHCLCNLLVGVLFHTAIVNLNGHGFIKVSLFFVGLSLSPSLPLCISFTFLFTLNFDAYERQSSWIWWSMLCDQDAQCSMNSVRAAIARSGRGICFWFTSFVLCVVSFVTTFYFFFFRLLSLSCFVRDWVNLFAYNTTWAYGSISKGKRFLNFLTKNIKIALYVSFFLLLFLFTFMHCQQIGNQSTETHQEKKLNK